jgi:hypothetical protein
VDRLEEAGGPRSGALTVAAVSRIRAAMPLLARHEGRWTGRYRVVTPQLELLDEHAFEIDVSFPEDGAGGVTYRQESAYRWDDGRREARVFEARLEGEAAVFDNGRIGGRLWEIDDTTLFLRFAFASEPEVEVHEMIQLSPDSRDRARTWHWLRAGKLFQLTLVDERRAD